MKACILKIFCITLLLSIMPLKGKCKEIIGWLEMVRIYPGNLKMRAKIDTGAKSSSINIHNVQKFKRGQETWVKFELKEKTKMGNGKKSTDHRYLINDNRANVYPVGGKRVQ